MSYQPKKTAEIQLVRCGNWWQFIIWPDGFGLHNQRFIDADSSILAYCDIDDKSKSWHLKTWTPRRERIARRMARMLAVS